MRVDKTGRTPIEQGKPMISTEQTRQTVSRFGSDVELLRSKTAGNIQSLVDVSISSAKAIDELVKQSQQRLSRGEITPLEFGQAESVELRFRAEWLESAKQFLPMAEVFADLIDGGKVAMLSALVDEAVQQFHVREESKRKFDAFIAKHPIPAEWNAEFVEQSMEIGEGIDARDYIASLPR